MLITEVGIRLFNLVKDVGEKLWDAVTGNHDTTDLAKKMQEHLNKTGIPNAGKVGVQINEDEAAVPGEGLGQEVKEKILIAIGSISGIASVDDQVKTSTPANENQFYTVRFGDTLSAIAKQVYDDANLCSQIFEADKPILKSPDKIYPGQVLHIPEQ